MPLGVSLIRRALSLVRICAALAIAWIWDRILRKHLLVGVGLLAGSLGLPPALAEGRTATLLMANDTYRIGGVDEGRSGGIPRLRTLRAELEQAAPDLLVLHAGDLLFPSTLSRRYGGAQMIDLLNRLDGDDGAFDPRLWVTFGNHEFDRDQLAQAAELAARLRESRFHWLGTNILFVQDEVGRPLVSAPNLASSALVLSGGIRIGLFSLTTDVKHPDYVATFEDPLQVARRMTALLRQQGAEVVVALTHQPLGTDLRLLETLAAGGPDLIIGGHEHERQVHRAGGHRQVIKADADARSVGVVRIHLDESGGMRIEPELRLLDGAVAPDPALLARVRDWQARFDGATCTELGEPPGCLDQPLGHTQVPLEAEELRIRRFETNLGNFVADQALAAFSDRGAQIAFINAGALRLNEDLPAGTRLTQGHLLDLFAYPSPLVLLRLDGATLQKIAERAVQDWTGNGWWLQIAGFAFRQEPETERVTDLSLLTPQGPRAVRPDEVILAVTSDFLSNPATGQDGYRMIDPAARLTRPEQGPDLQALVAEALRRAEPGGIAPQRQGRICNPQQPGPCLATVDGAP